MALRAGHLRLISKVIVISAAGILAADCGAGGPANTRQAVSIIFDTDIGTDVDDAGALAILHVLADRGEAKILAAMSANRNRWSAPAIDVINTYYGRADLPIGSSKSGPNPEEWYHESVPAYPHDLTTGDDAGEAVALYRKILSAQPDQSVTIVVVGWLTNMAELLNSKPDEHSPLNGRELVKAKVKELVSMGGTWPNSQKDEGEYNFHMDGPAAYKVISDWPGKIVFTGLGRDVMTGGKLVAQAAKDNPVPSFYRNFFKANNVSERSSWDLIGVLYAVRGLSDYFTAVSDGKCMGREDGGNQWVPGPAQNHSYLLYKMPPAELAGVIEALLLTPPAAEQLRNIIGVTHVNGQYHLTDKDFLNEGADQILSLGSRVIKVWFDTPSGSYRFNSEWPKAGSMVEIAQSPYFRKLFDKPFTTYILMCFSMGRPAGYFRDGLTDEQRADEQKQFYDLAKHLLTTYKGSGKTFILQHWEGDWLIRGNFNKDVDPEPKAIQGMIDWLNARQAGVNQAKKEISQDGVRVYHAAEVNLVVASMEQNRPGLVNAVLPHTKLDLVSYSAWDSATAHFEDPNILRLALDFIAKNAPDSPDFGDKNVYVGEFGMPENEFGVEKIRKAIPPAVNTALDWGCPYIVYWQVYCNELRPGKGPAPVKNNDDVRGFWLIRPDGSKTWLWDYFYNLLNLPATACL